MSIPHCFDHLLGAKPRHPQLGALVAPLPLYEIAPLSQIPGLNLMQFNNIGNFRPNVALHIPRTLQLGPAGLNTCSIELSIEGATTNTQASSLTLDMN